MERSRMLRHWHAEGCRADAERLRAGSLGSKLALDALKLVERVVAYVDRDVMAEARELLEQDVDMLEVHSRARIIGSRLSCACSCAPISAALPGGPSARCVTWVATSRCPTKLETSSNASPRSGSTVAITSTYAPAHMHVVSLSTRRPSSFTSRSTMRRATLTHSTVAVPRDKQRGSRPVFRVNCPGRSSARVWMLCGDHLLRVAGVRRGVGAAQLAA